jgi:hypothetical protein
MALDFHIADNAKVPHVVVYNADAYDVVAHFYPSSDQTIEDCVALTQIFIARAMTNNEPNRLKAWLMRNRIFLVNHWWGFRARAWYVFLRDGRLQITRHFPHTDYRASTLRLAGSSVKRQPALKPKPCSKQNETDSHAPTQAGDDQAHRSIDRHANEGAIRARCWEQCPAPARQPQSQPASVRQDHLARRASEGPSVLS